MRMERGGDWDRVVGRLEVSVSVVAGLSIGQEGKKNDGTAAKG